MSVDVLLHEVTGANDSERAFIRDAVRYLREAVTSPGFGSSVRQADYADATLRSIGGKYRQVGGDQIWDRIQSGREGGQTGDHALDLAIEIVDLPGPDDGAKAQIGEASFGELPIRSARWYLVQCMQANDRVNYAAHLMHQWLHVSGFVHREGTRGRDAPAIVAKLVRRALEAEHGDQIDARLTALTMMDHAACGAAVEESVAPAGKSAA